ncbi:E3 ubiquitin-protein ligase Topors-like isoform X2 [Teleopsis dalmanni]|uniref:E3 ubiquitin-protein ligase Topors-like isoform X2 n=1 Tax=Teleopsis dalmanni TaxID=139649 RepID=UPI0018CF11EA|nr:E3 ubiquitin-protein ligase Topors-like isoform X2 [Teleopsis dalmanni]
MAESSALSPASINGNVAVDLHTNVSAPTLNDNSNGSLDVNFTHHVGEVGVDMQCPATPRLIQKLPDFTTSNSESESEEQAQVTTSGTSNEVEPTRAASPPPNCAICLGRCKNKCFTDSCMHQFCFKCLCEWSKIKPECPLCKQAFKSIIHNVKSFDQFEEYHVPLAQMPGRGDVNYNQLPYIVENVVVGDFEIVAANWGDSRLDTLMHTHVFPHFNDRYPRTPGRRQLNSLVQTQYTHRGEVLNMYRQENPDGTSGTLSQLWRRYVYDRKLYALPVYDVTGRMRECNARFYRDNPAQLHRLMPWINRDIVCLLRNTDQNVTTVLESISETLTRFDIISVAFRRRVHSYLGEKTAHFIHELSTFARSPYDMIGYDRVVQYAPQVTEELVVEFSSTSESSEDDMIGVDILSDRNSPRNFRGFSEYRVQSRSESNTGPTSLVNFLSYNVTPGPDNSEITGFSAVGGSERNAQTIAINLTTHNRSNDDIIDLDALEPSGSDNTINIPANNTVPEPAATITFSDTGDDECEFVLELKPPHLRTPELVSLNSESDSDVVFVNESKAENQSKNNKPENNNENINVGASTSSGLRSSGRQRWQKNMNEQNKVKSRLRRRRSIRARSEPKNRPVGSDTSTPFYSSSSSDESDHTQHEKKRAAVRKIVQRKASNVKRSAQQNLQPAYNQKSKRRKVSSSDYTSEEDEEFLSALKRRLEIEKEKLNVSAGSTVKNEQNENIKTEVPKYTSDNYSSESDENEDDRCTFNENTNITATTAQDYCLESNPIENEVVNHSTNNYAFNNTVNMPEHFTESSSNPDSYQRAADVERTDAAIILTNLSATLSNNNNNINIDTTNAGLSLFVDTSNSTTSTSSSDSLSSVCSSTSSSTMSSSLSLGMPSNQECLPDQAQYSFDARYDEAAAVLAGFANTDMRFQTTMAASTDHLSNDSESNTSNDSDIA